MRSTLLLLAALLVAAPAWAQSPSWDPARIRNLELRLEKLRKEADRAADEGDPDKFQRKLVEIVNQIDETIETLSPEARPFARMHLRLLEPVLAERAVYFRHLMELSESKPWDVSNLSSPEELADRIKKIDDVLRSTRRLSSLLNDAESGIKDIIRENEPNPRLQKQLIREADQLGRKKFDPLRKSLNANETCFDQLGRILGHLHKHWGKWSYTRGSVQWSDRAAGEEIAELGRTLRVVIDAHQTAAAELARALQSER